MEIKDAKVGRKVIYSPYHNCPAHLKESGVITAVKKYVFVRYGNNVNSKATNASDLEYEN